MALEGCPNSGCDWTVSGGDEPVINEEKASIHCPKCGVWVGHHIKVRPATPEAIQRIEELATADEIERELYPTADEVEAELETIEADALEEVEAELDLIEQEVADANARQLFGTSETGDLDTPTGTEAVKNAAEEGQDDTPPTA